MSSASAFLQAVWSRQPHPGFAFVACKVDGEWMPHKAISFRGQAVAPPYDTEQPNQYFLPALFSAPRHTSANVLPSRWLWADLDGDKGFDGKVPDSLRPTLVWRTSPGNYHALWLLDRAIPRDALEELNKRLAARLSGDTTGWDAQQALRIPGTISTKPARDAYRVRLVDTGRPVYKYADLCALLPPVPVSVGNHAATAGRRLPAALPDRWDVLAAYRRKLGNDYRLLTTDRAVSDRSGYLWYLIPRLAAAGLSRPEALAVLRGSVLAKGGPVWMWREVCAGYERYERARGCGAEQRSDRVKARGNKT